MTIVFAIIVLLVTPSRLPAAQLATGRWEYRLSWNGIPAASALVSVSREPEAPDPVFRVEATARTNWFADLFWSLRARAASRFNGGAFTPLGFRYDREINDEPSATEVVFRASDPRATGILRRRGQTRVMDDPDPAAVDPITAIFQALTQPFEVGRSLRYHVFTGESRYRVDLAVMGAEPVTVGIHTYPAWRVEPQLWKLGTGPDQRLRRATIWVSQEPVRVLLKIRSEVFIGAVNCDLVSPAVPADSPS